MAQATEENFKIEHSREHLANERTFLAWIRTSLGIIGLGFVVVKFSMFVREMELMVQRPHQVQSAPSYTLTSGIVLIVIGAICTLTAFIRYKKTQRSILEGRFHQSNLLITVVTALMLVAAAVLVFYLVNTT